jgi:hypothetical protein
MSNCVADAIRKGKNMIRNDEAIWCRLELQCLLTLIKLGQPGPDIQTQANKAGGGEQLSATDFSNNFGGNISAPASSIAAGAIGNAFAKAGMPATAGVIPVYSSADCI